MPKLVKYPRKPKRVEIDGYVLQEWNPRYKEWSDVLPTDSSWHGGIASAMNKKKKIVRIISRRGKVTEKVEAFWGPNGIERRPGESNR